MKLLKVLGWLAASGIVALMCGAVWVSARGYFMYRQAVDTQPLAMKIEEIREKPGFVPLSELPQTYINAVVAVEDHRFYGHNGIDVWAIGRAMWNNLCAGRLVQGGSTITQQLAKNLYFTQEKRFARKVAEVFTAWLIEDSCTKREILELYVNAIYFGEGYTGVGEAAQGYFGKSAGELNFDEATMLAGVPNAPSAYAPSQNPELAAQRQAQVLRQMRKYGYLPPQPWQEEPASEIKPKTYFPLFGSS